ncbi:MAG: hypothetical protein O7H41_10860 [Planctomycetota bacterium]|nr:hypothetical protein [Planctomycetota bacterium]
MKKDTVLAVLAIIIPMAGIVFLPGSPVLLGVLAISLIILLLIVIRPAVCVLPENFLMEMHIGYPPSKRTPRFFRPQGPQAVDFAEGFVVRRPESDMILRKLRTEGVVAIEGIAASGKSVILNSVGYKLLVQARRRPVYYVSLKDEERPRIGDMVALPKFAIVIVDDCHLDIAFAEKILSMALQCHLVLASRPLAPDSRNNDEEDRGLGIGTPRSLTKRTQLDEAFNDAIRIVPDDVASDLIDLFAEKRAVSISYKTKNAIIEQYEENLMLVTWALDSIEHHHSADTENVALTAADWLLPDAYTAQGFYASVGINDRNKISPETAAKLILTLAPFYRFEIPIDRQFLLNVSAADPSELDILLKSRILSGRMESIGLAHSVLANVFVDSARRIDRLHQIASTISVDYPHGVLSLYLQRNFSRSCSVIARIPTWESEGIEALRRLFATESQAILRALHMENDIEITGDCIRSLADAVEHKRDLKLRIEDTKFIDSIIKKITLQHDLRKVGRCLDGIAAISKGAATRLLPEFVKKINAESDVEAIARSLAYFDSYTKRELMKDATLDKALLVHKLSKEKDISKIGMCLLSLGPLLSSTLESEELDIESLARSFCETEKLSDIIWSLDMLARASERVALDVIRSAEFGPDALARKASAEPNAFVVANCLSTIHRLDKQTAARVLDSAHFRRREFIKRLEDLQELEVLTAAIWHIASVSYEIVVQLAPVFAHRLNAESDLEKIFNALRFAGSQNPRILATVLGTGILDAEKIERRLLDVSSVDHLASLLLTFPKSKVRFIAPILESDSFTTHVNQLFRTDADFPEIASCLQWVHGHSEVATERIMSAGDFKTVLMEGLSRETDLGRIGEFYADLAWVSEEFSMELVPTIVQKLNTEQDVVKVAEFFRFLELQDRLVAMLIESPDFDSEALDRKLESEQDFARLVGSVCLFYQARLSFEDASFSAMNLESKKKADKDINEEDLESIGESLWSLAQGNRNVADTILSLLEPETLERLRENQYLPWPEA